ncbi:MAG: molybdopterin/thiamine biosynthesis adenylyltransferase [Ascidiaceihabitans sp.]|jgi:molybdopterin/thiamine biosynthesis adenylyltransferase
MLFVLISAIVIWFACFGFSVPYRGRWVLFGSFPAAIVFFLLIVPIPENKLNYAVREMAEPWAMFFGLGVLIWGYRWGLGRLRSKAEVKVAETQVDSPLFSDTELNRYARHIVMREMGGPGQKALKEASVLVVGAGGLGSPVLQYLAAAGVGTIGIIDDDVVDNANLQRQVIHRDSDIGLPKVFSAQAAMIAQNPYVTVRPYERRLTDEIAEELISEYDLVLDGCDNFETRYLVNRICVALGKPLISGALTQWEGQLSVFDPANDAPCYQCIFPQAPAPELAPSCAEAGVIGPLPGVVGSMMAVEAIKVITDAGASLRGEMIIYDALYGESRKITLESRADCPICGTQ